MWCVSRLRPAWLLATVFIYLVMFASLSSSPAGGRVIAAPGVGEHQAGIELSNMKLIAQVGGINMALTVAGDLAYASQGGRLLILDISTPAAPLLIGQTTAVPAPILGVAVQGDYAYLAAGESGMWVVDVTDSSAPVLVGHWQAVRSISQVVVHGNYAYATAGILFVVDVSEPSNPRAVGEYIQGVMDIVIADGYAYLATDRGLDILTLDDPVHLQRIGHMAVDGHGLQVAVLDGYAYYSSTVFNCSGIFCMSTEQVLIVDIGDKTAPLQVSYQILSGMPTDIAVDPTTLYLAIYGDIETVNISDPANPQLGNTITTPGCAGYGGQTVRSGAHLYLADCEWGMRVIDVSDPSAPLETGHYDETMLSPIGLTIKGGRAYIPKGSGGLSILDIVSPTNLELVGSYTGPGYISKVAVADGHAYVADERYGLRILDISDLGAITEVSAVEIEGGAIDVVVSGGYAYVAAREMGLHIFDVGDVTDPHEVGSLDNHDQYWEVKVVEDIAYLAIDTAGLWIVDVSDRQHPRDISNSYGCGWILGIAVDGQNAYLADGGNILGSGNLIVMDLKRLHNPIITGHHQLPGQAVDVMVDDSFAYVASLRGGVTVFDIASPAEPKEAGYFRSLTSGINDLAAHEGLIYASDPTLGLLVLDHQGPHTLAGRITLPGGLALSGVWVAAAHIMPPPITRGDMR